MADKVLSDRISPELAAVLKEIPSSNPLGQNTVLSPLHRELFFVEIMYPIAIAGRRTFKSSYRHSLPPSPLLHRGPSRCHAKRESTTGSRLAEIAAGFSRADLHAGPR
jgi:hypothetical protein